MNPKQTMVVFLCLIMLWGGVIVTVPGDATAVGTGSITTSKGALPQTYEDWESGWAKCTWNNLAWSQEGEDQGQPTIVCMWDGGVLYSSTSDLSGTYTKAWAPFELTTGTHTFAMDYSISWNQRIHDYNYGSLSGTVTISCLSKTVSIRIEVYSGGGSVVVDSTTYTNWQEASVSAGCRNAHTINATPNTGFTFYQWAADRGSLASRTADPTTFYPDYRAKNHLAMVVDLGISNWGGYVATNNGTSLDFTDVVGRFVLPTNPTYVAGPPGSPTKSVYGIWVGIGGNWGGTGLWQAGVAVNVSSTNVVTITPWYEWIPATGTPNPPVYDNSHHPAAGDTIEVELWKNLGTGKWWWSVKDITAGWTWSNTIDGVNPDTSTAEWIAEAPGAFTMPAGSTFSFTSLSVYGSDGGGWVLPWSRNTGNDASCANQRLTPGQIWGAAFTITYSGPC